MLDILDLIRVTFRININATLMVYKNRIKDFCQWHWLYFCMDNIELESIHCTVLSHKFGSKI